MEDDFANLIEGKHANNNIYSFQGTNVRQEKDIRRTRPHKSSRNVPLMSATRRYWYSLINPVFHLYFFFIRLFAVEIRNNYILGKCRSSGSIFPSTLIGRFWWLKCPERCVKLQRSTVNMSFPTSPCNVNPVRMGLKNLCLQEKEQFSCFFKSLLCCCRRDFRCWWSFRRVGLKEKLNTTWCQNVMFLKILWHDVLASSDTSNK